MKKRILTGDRPTGKLHLGHYVGSLANRLRLQDEYETFIIIADLYTLTTSPEKTGELQANIRDLVLDYLAVGLDPAKVTIYLQSAIPEVGELAIILGMLTTVSRLSRVPTLKDVMTDLRITNPSYGLLGYPVLQAADILGFRAHLVPVGKDQVSHLEVTREIARQFNRLYGEIFPEPEPLVGEVPILPGIDGQAKMSKSLGNVINLSDPPEVVEKQVMKMYTDPNRIHGTEPGKVEGNPVFIYHEAFNANKAEVEQLKAAYLRGEVGDVEVKHKLVKALNNFLQPIRDRRQHLAESPNLVEMILEAGTIKARHEVRKTLAMVKKAMKMDFFGEVVNE